MKNILLNLIFFSLVLSGCNEFRDILKKSSPHEEYERMLSESGLAETALGKAWIKAAQQALHDSVQIQLPYKERSIFLSIEASAFSYRFSARRGEIITVKADFDTISDLRLFIDLFLIGAEVEREAFAESDSFNIEYEVDEDVDLLVRVQPELLAGGSFTLIIEHAPSLAFPVLDRDSREIKSIWGDRRDGGARQHQGVDIFAPRGTPVLAAADGIISRTGTNNLGGKVVWLSSGIKNLYYAHLDSQTVSPGQKVKTGDTLGLVGNTGNAINTPPHLHFGVYFRGEGAVDPFPFIRNVFPDPPEININENMLGKWARIKAPPAYVRISTGATEQIISALKRNYPFKIYGGTSNWYKIVLPDGRKGFIPSSKTEGAEDPLRILRISSEDTINIEMSSAVVQLTADELETRLTVHGENEDFYLINYYQHFLLMRKN